MQHQVVPGSMEDEKVSYVYDPMKSKPAFYILALAIFSLCCGTDSGNKRTAASDTTPAIIVSTDTFQRGTIEFKDTFDQKDLPVDEYLAERLAPTRANYRRINSIANWTTIRTNDIWETTEGGEAQYYYLNGQLEKIVSRHFGETFQLLTEYYLLKGQISFVFEKSFQYNRPIYYDSTTMKEMDDTVVFNFERSAIIEKRSSFEHAKLLHQINSQRTGSPFGAAYLTEEQKRIKTNFEKLIKPGAIK